MIKVIGEEKSPLSEIEHFGVKGMHWGVRKKKEPLETHPDYTRRQQTNDRRSFGKGGVKRINKRMHAGMKRADAVKAEQKLQTRAALAVTGAAIAARLLIVYGPTLLSNFNTTVAVKAHNNRVKANAARISDLRGLPSTASKLKYTKPGRGGVYNITTAR